MPTSDAWVGASLLAATTARGEVSVCASPLSRAIGFDAEEVALEFEESVSAGVSAEASEFGANSGADKDSVLVASVGRAATTFPEDALLVPPVTVPGIPEPLSPAGVLDEPEPLSPAGVLDEPELLPPAGVPGEPEVFPPLGAPPDEEDAGGEFVGGGVVLLEGSSSPDDDPSDEEEPSVEPEEEPLEDGLSSPSSLPPSSSRFAELEPSSPDDEEGVEEEVLLGAGDGDADVLLSSVELPLVFGLSPEESSDPVSAIEPCAVELAFAFEEGAPEGELTFVPDAAVVGE